MGNLTIEELASSLGLSSLPEKCRDFFDEVMKDFDKMAVSIPNQNIMKCFTKNMVFCKHI